MGTDRTTEIYRALVYELLNWRVAQRELKALIKARYRGWGVLRLNGVKVFSARGRAPYLEQLPAEEERRMMRRLMLSLITRSRSGKRHSKKWNDWAQRFGK
jgi:hypothetical protein